MSSNSKNEGGLLQLPPRNASCFGTRQSIALRRAGKSGDSPGMVATFSCPQESATSPYLLVLVSDGSTTWQGRVLPKNSIATGKKNGCFVESFFGIIQKRHTTTWENLYPKLLKRELAEARAMAVASSAQKKRQRPPPPPSYAALSDDHDAQEFDSEMVEMLATGKRTRTGDHASSKQKAKRKQKTSAIRKNPMTGANKVFDAQAILNNPSFFGISSQDNGDSKKEASKSKNDKVSSADDGGNDNGKKHDGGPQHAEGEADATETATSTLRKDPMAFASVIFAKGKQGKWQKKQSDDSPPQAKGSKKDANNEKSSSFRPIQSWLQQVSCLQKRVERRNRR